MTFLERWQSELPASLDTFAQIAPRAKDVDFTYGLLAAAVLWPARGPVHAYDGAAGDVLRELVGTQAGALLRIVNGWPDDRLAAARALADEAARSEELRTALLALIERFEAARLFAERLARGYTPQAGASSITVSEQIRAALVNVGGITNIDSLTVHLDQSVVVQHPRLSRRTLAAGLGLAATFLVAAAIVIYQFVAPRLAPEETMKGALNIAVAQLQPTAGAGCAVTPDSARGISDVVHETLERELSGTLAAMAPGRRRLLSDNDIQIWSPGKTGQVTPETVRQRAQAINADVVLFGELWCESNPSRTRVAPAIYVTDRKDKSFEHLEFTGAHLLGSAVSGDGHPDGGAARGALRAQLLSRMAALSQFLLGLDSYFAGQYEEAQAAFTAAAQAEGLDDPRLGSMMQLFAGTAAGRRGELGAARASYEAAIASDPGNVRAHFSLAEWHYFDSMGDCEASEVAPGGPAEKPEGLREALRGYQEAWAMPEAREHDGMPVLVPYGIGRTYVCMSQAGIESRWNEASLELQRAIGGYDAADDQMKERLRDVAAEAHSLLGVVYLPSAADPPDVAERKLRVAGGEYCAALSLSRYAQRHGYYHSALGYIYRRLGDYEKADAAYLKAAENDPQQRSFYEGLRAELADEREAGGARTVDPICGT
ncbi:MAG: hypothetical protein RLZZ387_4446 [Chloroflexota bacterium]